MRDFSQEVIDLVLDEVAVSSDMDHPGHSSIAKCGLVCRRWASRSRFHILRELWCEGPEIEQFLSLLDTSSFPLLAMARSLYIFFPSDNSYKREHLARLSEGCVSLTQVVMTIDWPESEDSDVDNVSYSVFLETYLPVMGLRCGSHTHFEFIAFSDAEVSINTIAHILASLPALQEFKIAESTREPHIVITEDEQAGDLSLLPFPAHLNVLDLHGVVSGAGLFFDWLVSLPVLPAVDWLQIYAFERESDWNSLHAYTQRTGHHLLFLDIDSEIGGETPFRSFIEATDSRPRAEPRDLLRHASQLRHLSFQCRSPADVPDLLLKLTSIDLEEVLIVCKGDGRTVADADELTCRMLELVLKSKLFRRLERLSIENGDHASLFPAEARDSMPLAHARGDAPHGMNNLFRELVDLVLESSLADLDGCIYHLADADNNASFLRRRSLDQVSAITRIILFYFGSFCLSELGAASFFYHASWIPPARISLMASTISLCVLSVSEISWKPGVMRGEKPNMYVALYRDGVEVQRTRTIKRELSPKWEHIFRLASDVKMISLRVSHASNNPFSKHKCLGSVDIDVPTFVERVSQIRVFEELKLTSHSGTDSGMITVHLIGDDNQVAAAAVAKARKDIERIALADQSSAIVLASLLVGSELASTLASVTSKVSTVMRIGNELATIHPYATMAWKILTGVYQVVKKQQDTNDKLMNLVQTMDQVYDFVEAVEFLPQKVKSLEKQVSSIVKVTVECALFIQEYTAHGFCTHAIQGIWDTKQRKIDGLCHTLVKLKESFDSGLTIQSLLFSIRIMDKLDGLQQSDTLKRLNPVDMNASLRNTCLTGTRQKMLDNISDWVTLPSASGNVLWLSGVAGCGKSTISTTISERFRALDRLGAFLFFQRNDPAHSDPSAVIRTLAYSLGIFNSHIASAISVAIEQDAAIVNAPIQTQFAELLLAPLQSVEQYMDGPVLIILDALDECGSMESRSMLLSFLAEEFPKLPPVFRFLLTSRRESDIAGQFRNHFKEISLDPDTTVTTTDIEVFFRHETTQIRKQKI
ncbi:hypothetical protein FB45DRAFT_1126799 [Roridomyces roridus]|uniref:C2 domain-containing protein n=1 Tax=Roridomyces roridus TaxID=1738132 RepID=A0AAD7B3H1_9AGAR|nr:hypothetical protein FB45DRAFT_1126799 [Roridomyces roridus]